MLTLLRSFSYSSGLLDMAGQVISDEDLEAASKDIMSTIDEDGDGDVTKVCVKQFSNS